MRILNFGSLNVNYMYCQELDDHLRPKSQTITSRMRSTCSPEARD